MTSTVLSFALSLMLAGQGSARPLHAPTATELVAAYRRADTLGATRAAQATMLRLEPRWIEDGGAFWYRKDGPGETAEFLRVDARTGVKTPLFDAPRLAAALQKETGGAVDPTKLPFRTLVFDGNTFRFDVARQSWSVDLGTYGLRKLEATPTRPGGSGGWVQDLVPPSRTPKISPDGAWTARIEGTNLVVRPKGGEETPLTTDGTESAYYARFNWSPDSKRLIAVRVHPGDRKQVYLLQNSPPDGGAAKLTQHVYDRPGDRIDTFDILTIDPSKATPPVPAEAIEYGGVPSFRPTKDGAFTYEKTDRGYGRWRILRLDPTTGRTTTIVDDDPATFVDSTAQIRRYLQSTDEVVVSSERDGWHHLYLADGKGDLTQITKGPWVVRGIEKVDEARRQIVFTASGMDPAEDPYYIHYYRIDFDGTGLVPLTPAKGNHTASFSPDGTTLFDAYSTPVQPPVYELRRADTGTLVSTVDKADTSRLPATGWRAPEPFVAKGRDGKTDIYGLVYRPSNFNPNRRYPVVEDIYAGPQDSFVPKTFSAAPYDQGIAELGFIVVKIDGMGTRNRSKAFHDVAYRNLADAGFPDRILWMKALGAKYPQVDLTRVGVFGTSAGGQNAGGAVLFHPDFYKVAVASCGCHDNALDKIWWNEQWMGVMGPHYAANSNIVNAAKLRGRLMLMVGELDTNVPPESTYRYAEALQRAGKEYELVVLPNAGHTAGGPYGERKRRDFFVRHLLGIEPPDPNR